MTFYSFRPMKKHKNFWKWKKKQITESFTAGNRLEFYDATEEEACQKYYKETFEKNNPKTAFQLK